MSGKPGSGKPKDGSRNPSWANAATERERSQYKLAGLPKNILRKPVPTYTRGLAMVETLKLIEVQLTEWEDKQTDEFLELLPWWEERKKYRVLKAEGNVPEVHWWEALAFLESSHPKRIEDIQRWGMRDRKREKKKAP